MRSVTIAADLDFRVEVPGGATVNGHVHGAGNDLVVEVDDPTIFAGRSDAPAVRALAAGLARRGLRVQVVDREHHLITLGAVRTSWWQRRLTGSRHIRLGSLRGAWTGARSRAGADRPVLPDATLAPPATLFPVARRSSADPAGRSPPPTTRCTAATRGSPWSPRTGCTTRTSRSTTSATGHHDRLRRTVRRTPAAPRRSPRPGPSRRGRRDRPRGQRPRGPGARRAGDAGRSCAPAAGSTSASGRSPSPGGVRRPRAAVRRPDRRRARPPAPAAGTPRRQARLLNTYPREPIRTGGRVRTTCMKTVLPALKYAAAGVLATLAGMSAGHLVAAAMNPASSPVLAVGSTVIDLTPTPMKEWAVRSSAPRTSRS